MKNDWWFKMEHLTWLTDEQLNRCSLETQGFWIRSICVMHKSVSARLIGTEAELVRLLSVTPGEFRRCVAELNHTKAATVTQTAKSFTIMSRKYAKELRTREQSRLRKRRERGHAEVADESQDRVKSKSKEIDKEKKEEEKKAPAAALTDEQWLQSLAENPAYKNIPVLIEFERAKVWADTNNRQCTRRFFIGWLNRAKPMDVNINGTTKQPSEREKSAQRNIEQEQLAHDIRSGKYDEAVERLFSRDGDDNSEERILRQLPGAH